MGPRMVDFNVFKVEYWTCLSGMIPSSCPPKLLFSEIIGVIKGSSFSAKSLKPLTREEYLSRSSKGSQSFSGEGDRERIYSAYERYEKLKKQRNEVDELDRVIGLLQCLKGDPGLGQLAHQCFEEIYVDGNIPSCGLWMSPKLTQIRGARSPLLRYCAVVGLCLWRSRCSSW